MRPPFWPLCGLLLLGGCSGFGHFLGDANGVALNRNAPRDDSLNARRARGQEPAAPPLRVEPGDVWPPPPQPEPSLADIQRHPEAYPLPPPLEMGDSTPHAQPRPAAHLPSARPSAGEERQETTPEESGAGGTVTVPNGDGTASVILPDGHVRMVPEKR